MIADATLDFVLEEAIARLAPPPPPRGLLEFARSLRLPDGPQAGEAYDPSSHPAGFEILRAFAAGGFDEFVTLGPGQDGKTWNTVLVPMMYFIAELRLPVVFGLPDRSLAGKAWRSKLRPAIEACGLGHLLPTEGPGSDGGAPEDVLFKTGARLFMLGAGARNEAGQAMVTAPAVFVDERDSIRPRWVELLWTRANAYDALARRVSTSTLKHDVGSTTDGVYTESTASRLWFRCPHCVAGANASGGWQTFEPSRLAYDATDDFTAAATAHLVCLHDGAHRITEDQRRAMLVDWRLVARGQTVAPDGSVCGDMPATRIWGLRWSSLDSPLKSLPLLAVRHRQACARRDAHGDHEPLRQFFRDQWACGYRDEIEGAEGVHAISPAYLAARSNAHGWATMVPDKAENGAWSRYAAAIPALASIAVAEIDVQENRCYWSLIAADADLRTWDCAWGYEYATVAQDPMSKGELHSVLDRIRDLLPAMVKHEDRVVPVVAKGIDVGYRQDEIVEWLSGNHDWLPLSGAGEEAVGKMRAANAAGDMPGVVYRRRLEAARLHARQLLHLVEVDRVKETAQNGFLRPAGAAGAAHLPRGLKAKDAYLHHLCGEVLEENPRTGRRVWRVINKRHDYLDLRAYGIALLRLYLRNLAIPKSTRRYGVVGPLGA